MVAGAPRDIAHVISLNHPVLIVVVAICSWPMYRLLAKSIFGAQYQTLARSLQFWMQSDWKSRLDGEEHEDRLGTFRIQAFAWACLLWVGAVSEGICRLAVLRLP